MKSLIRILILLCLISCGQNKKRAYTPVNKQIELYNAFDTANHLQPLFDKLQFDTLHDWEFGWAILEPINIAKSNEDEIRLSKRFSAGQKALYFFWYLDAQVTNGGFIQFYWNGHRQYLPPIMRGLQLIGDTSMINLVSNADKEYITNKNKFDLEKQKDDWNSLYDNLKNFERYDSLYNVIHNNTIKLIEAYARRNANEFVKFR